MKKVIVILALFLCGVVNAELLPDGGFESGMWSGYGGIMYNGGPLSTWGYVYGGQYSVSQYAGNYFGSFYMPSHGYGYTSPSYSPVGLQSWNSGLAIAWQEGLAAAQGDVLQATAYVKELNGFSGTDVAMMKFEFVDSAGYILSEEKQFFEITADWTKITTDPVAVPYNGFADVTMVVGMEDSGVGYRIGFDNVSLSAYDCLDANLDGLDYVNLLDYAILRAGWLQSGTLPGDINGSGTVDVDDLKILASQWLNECPAPPPWFPQWESVTQCHGDADSLTEGGDKTGYYHVSTNDLSILVAAWDTELGDLLYDPGADFNRDLKVNQDDQDIMNMYWLISEPPLGPGIPKDCPTSP